MARSLRSLSQTPRMTAEMLWQEDNGSGEARGKWTEKMERQEDNGTGEERGKCKWSNRNDKEDEDELQDEHIHAKRDVFTHVVPMPLGNCPFPKSFPLSCQKAWLETYVPKNACAKNIWLKAYVLPRQLSPTCPRFLSKMAS